MKTNRKKSSEVGTYRDRVFVVPGTRGELRVVVFWSNAVSAPAFIINGSYGSHDHTVLKRLSLTVDRAYHFAQKQLEKRLESS